MLGIDNFPAFLTAGILLNICPGPDSMYVIARSVSQGRSAGTCAALGISTGAVFHTLLGAAGLSALLFSSAKAFTVIKIAGALYLFFQAVIMLRDSCHQNPQPAKQLSPSNRIQIYRQGALTNILNPKVALFFLALIPQFITPASSNKPLAFLLLGLAFITTGTIWCLLLARFASLFSAKFRQNSHTAKWLLRANSTIFGYLGFRLATSHMQNPG